MNSATAPITDAKATDTQPQFRRSSPQLSSQHVCGECSSLGRDSCMYCSNETPVDAMDTAAAAPEADGICALRYYQNGKPTVVGCLIQTIEFAVGRSLLMLVDKEGHAVAPVSVEHIKDLQKVRDDLERVIRILKRQAA